MRRVRVGLLLYGTEQYYQREEEIRDAKTKRYMLRPYFVTEKRQAITMSEDLGLAMVTKLRGLKLNPFLEDVSNERRLDLPQQNVPDSGEDNRTNMIASLNDVDEYLVKPICRPSGRCWFIRIDVPGLPDPYVAYGEDPLACLRKAEDLNYLRFAERYERPQPQHAAPVKNSNVARRRPGDFDSHRKYAAKFPYAKNPKFKQS
jgi:hypothetical protein